MCSQPGRAAWAKVRGLEQPIHMKRTRELPADVKNWRQSTAIGGLQQKFTRALPVRIGLIELGKVEKQVARLRQGRQRAAVIQVKGCRQSASPCHGRGAFCSLPSTERLTTENVIAPLRLSSLRGCDRLGIHSFWHWPVSQCMPRAAVPLLPLGARWRRPLSQRSPAAPRKPGWRRIDAVGGASIPSALRLDPFPTSSIRDL